MKRGGGLHKPMPDVAVVLVEPKVPGNVGAVARVMANFGFHDLVLVNPPRLGDPAYRRAKHGGTVLKEATRASSLEEALEGLDLAVGTTGVPSDAENAFHRHAVTPWELAAKLAPVEGRVGVLLGRENYGLYNEELDRLDLLVHVPCSPAYPIMNLSHAAAVLLYELSRAGGPPAGEPPRLASGAERERLHDAFREMLVAIRYPEHRRRRTEVLFRRLVGRAAPSKWEFHALMGVVRGATKAVTRRSEFPGSGPSS